MTTTKIENLTPEQDAQLESYFQMGLKIGLRCTKDNPINKELVEEQVREIYRRAGESLPEQIVWQPNPVAAAMFVAKNSKPEYAMPAYAGYGTHDAAWLTFYNFMRNVLGLKEETEEMCGLAWAAEAGLGWYWPFSKVCVVSPPPSEIHVDEQGNLHHLDGPALGYEGDDSCDIYAYHGTEVPSDLINDHSKITVTRIDEEQNVEVRRCLMEIYGEGRYLEDSGATPIHEDRFGVLYRKDVPGDVPLVMVRVVNTVEEADGSRRVFFLHVPANCTTAREAVARGYGFTNPNDYNPSVET